LKFARLNPALDARHAAMKWLSGRNHACGNHDYWKTFQHERRSSRNIAWQSLGASLAKSQSREKRGSGTFGLLVRQASSRTGSPVVSPHQNILAPETGYEFN